MGTTTISRQRAYRVRFGWGAEGVRRLAPVSDVVVIVDVLSFSTCVDVATGRGAEVLPWAGDDAGAARHAADHGAELASRRGQATPGRPWTLSPASLTGIPAGMRLVLPSPNGSTLAALAAGAGAAVIAGCLRNATAVGLTAARLGRRVSVVAAGEHWDGRGGPWRPADEDLLGAGAILAAVGGDTSPEAWLAVAAFRAARPELAALVADGESGRELRERGFDDDVALATMPDVSDCVPVLVDGVFGRLEGGGRPGAGQAGQTGH